MHRSARIASIVLLVAGVVAIALLLAWSIHLHDHSTEYGTEVSKHAGARGGFAAVAFLLGTKYLVGLGCLIAVGIALTVVMIRGTPWSYPVTAIGGTVMLAAVWFARLVIVHMEDPRYRAKSPWVAAVTLVSIVATIYLVLVIAAATVSWKTRRPPAPPQRV